MMNCNEIKEQMSAYIDGEIDEAQRAEFEEHICSCTECRNELDELKNIVRMCNSIGEEELPDNFREELHSRLLAAKEENMRKNKVVELRSRYIGIISAVAACLLIIVLAGGFLSNSFFPKFSQKDIARTESAQEKAQAADESAEMSSHSAEDFALKDSASGKEDGTAKGEVQANEAQEFSIMANPGTTEPIPDDTKDITSRSTVPGERKKYLQKSAGENVYSNNVVINAKVNGEPDSEVENIRKLAIDNGGEFTEENYGIALLKEPQADVGEEKPETVILNFKISYNQYRNFFDSLAEYIGSENITADESSQDMSNAIEALNIRLDEVEDEINRIEKSGNTSSPEVLKSLKEERQNLINEIERIRLDSDYIFVTVYIQKN